MKNEEVVNLFKRYWGYQRFVKRFVIAIEAVLFVFFIYEVLFGPEPIGFFGFLWSVLWILFVLFTIYVIVSSVIEFVMNITVGTAFRYRAVEMLRRQFGRLIRSDFERTWLVNPGIFSIDCQDKYLLVSSSSTGYDAIRLDAGIGILFQGRPALREKSLSWKLLTRALTIFLTSFPSPLMRIEFRRSGRST